MIKTTTHQPIRNITIAGAGAIGCYLGVQLHKAGFNVTFLGSDRVTQRALTQGLQVEYPDALCENYSANTLLFSNDASCCARADLVVVAVKSGTTSTLIQQIKPHLPHTAILLTVQNGISNAATLKAAFAQHPVIGGMVTFNVIEKNPLEASPLCFRLTTPGEIHLEKFSPPLLPLFQQAGISGTEHDDLESILWSKLLLNLINPLNALSGLPLKQNLSDRSFRLHWARCIREGLAVLKAAGIKPAKVTPLPTSLLPFMLSLPNCIYMALAQRMTNMDATATSSMAQDLAKGNPTEIDYLNGAIIQLGKRVKVDTSENEKVYAAINKAEAMRR